MAGHRSISVRYCLNTVVKDTALLQRQEIIFKLRLCSHIQ